MSRGWRAELEKIWLELKVPHFLAAIHVDFEEAFLAPLRNSPHEVNPYADHTWSFFRLDRLPPGVLHASPNSKVGRTPALWEEWFIEGSVNHHHSMRNIKPKLLSDNQPIEYLTWRSPLNDVEHPETVLDVDWHYFNDADQRPYLLR